MYDIIWFVFGLWINGIKQSFKSCLLWVLGHYNKHPFLRISKEEHFYSGGASVDGNNFISMCLIFIALNLIEIIVSLKKTCNKLVCAVVADSPWLKGALRSSAFATAQIDLVC